MGCFRGASISIGIVGNNRVRTAATIAYCATDMVAKVSIDSYLGQHNLQIIPKRLSFEQYYPFISDRYQPMDLQLFGSMPIGQLSYLRDR